jgi:hypothetical protein
LNKQLLNICEEMRIQDLLAFFLFGSTGKSPSATGGSGDWALLLKEADTANNITADGGKPIRTTHTTETSLT